MVKSIQPFGRQRGYPFVRWRSLRGGGPGEFAWAYRVRHADMGRLVIAVAFKDRIAGCGTELDHLQSARITHGDPRTLSVSADDVWPESPDFG